jgi:hypothetical protein
MDFNFIVYSINNKNNNALFFTLLDALTPSTIFFKFILLQYYLTVKNKIL